MGVMVFGRVRRLGGLEMFWGGVGGGGRGREERRGEGERRGGERCQVVRSRGIIGTGWGNDGGGQGDTNGDIV